MRRVSRRPELPMAPVQIPYVLEPPVQIPHVPDPVQIPVSQVPQPPVCRFQMFRPCADSTCPRTTCADSTCPRTYADSTCPRNYADSPRAQHFGPFGVDGCTRPDHVVRIWTPSPRTPAASHGTLYF
ncbi:hypothetical protein TNCV_541161 [Trichonephila clavipes]|nr:hypothetical protein TNCV_541161 [Trichonephila clavipes]